MCFILVFGVFRGERWKEVGQTHVSAYRSRQFSISIHFSIIFHMKKQLITQCAVLYAKTLNPKSKWLKQDIAEYKANLSTLSITDIRNRLSKLNAMQDVNSTFNKQVVKEVQLLDKAGMFNVSKMQSKNCLD